MSPVRKTVLIILFLLEFSIASLMASGTVSIPITLPADPATKFAIVPVPVYRS